MNHDFDITGNYHRGDPQSAAAHANTAANHDNQCRQIAAYIEAQPRGATSYEAELAFAFIRPSVTARFSEVLWRHNTAFRVIDLHRFALFPDIEEKRRNATRPCQVVIGAQRLLSTYGSNALSLMRSWVAANRSPSDLGSKPPIERMTEAHWPVYDFVDACGRQGTIADTAQWRLGLDQGNSSNLFKDLRKCRAVVLVSALRRHGEFLDVTRVRQTRNHQSASVVVSAKTVFTSVSADQLAAIFTESEIDRLDRLLFS